MNLLPAIIFLVGCFLAFATGTSWGTFGILIPIVVAVFQGTNETMMIISISACMAGAVCGDHCSPISDTTIMASAGAQCNHVNHVSTQL
ncbi:Na+/H+ antiporter NhaC family protein, partial [Adlercreutzia equolifaciens]